MVNYGVKSFITLGPEANPINDIKEDFWKLDRFIIIDYFRVAVKRSSLLILIQIDQSELL